MLRFSNDENISKYTLLTVCLLPQLTAANPPLPVKYILGFFDVRCPVSGGVYESRLHPDCCAISLIATCAKGYHGQCKLPDVPHW